MKAALRKLFDHYRAHHDMDRPLLQWIGVMGCIAFPLFYFMRRAVAAPGYDDMWLRLLATALCLGLALRSRWPQRLRSAYLGYSWFVVFYCLAFFLSYTMLRNHGGAPQVINMLMAAVLIILLADWRNAITMLLGGYILAVLAHRYTAPQPEVVREFIFAAGGSLLAVLGGTLSNQGQKRVEINRLRRVYSGLAGSIAHEMRNPLAQVRHALDSIAATLVPGGRAADQQVNADQVAAVLATVQQGRDAVSRGLQAIELTLQQLRPAPMDSARVQTVSALACVRHAVDAFVYEDAGQRQRVAVLDEGDFHFRGDPAAMDLVLFNLLKNALYYLPLNPAMTVRITVAAGPVPRVIVHDSGPGIPDELQGRLFQEFQTEGKAEGTGLGLSFCRHVMRTMGGDIQCRSKQGQFTEFTLSFPPALANEPSQTPNPAAHQPLAGRTALVVDDQALNRAIARALARDLGLRTLEAEHGQQALDILRSGVVPDAILMDINMPGLDGIATTRRLREMPGAAARVPVLALTANDSPAVLAAARAAGLHAVLIKPIDAGALERALISALQSPGDPAVSTLATSESELLNTRRVNDFSRLGLMDELPGALVDMRRHLQALKLAETLGDLQAARDALHALVGLSGECGAQALHALARGRYAALLDGQAASVTVADELRGLLDATERALAQQYDVQVPA